MRKLLLSLFALFSTVGTWAGVTDLPEITTDPANPIYYVIHNTRSTSGKFIYYDVTANTLKDNNPSVAADKYKFYFTGTKEGDVLKVQIHNATAEGKVLQNAGSWATTEHICEIGVTPHSSKAGLYIKYGSGENDCLNEKNDSWNATKDQFTNWSANDEGSIFVIEKVEDVYMPEAGKTYFVEAPLFLNYQLKMKGLTDNGGTPNWHSVAWSNDNDKWVVGTDATGQISLKNVGTGKYLNGTAMSDTEVFGNIRYLGQGQYNIVIGGTTVHANGHGSGANDNGNLIHWAGNANSASAWKFIEATEENLISEYVDVYPMPITINDAEPEYVYINSGRGDNRWFTYVEDNGEWKISLEDRAEAKNDQQLWYFKTAVVDGNVLLRFFPKNGGGKAMSYNSTGNAAGTIVAKELGTDGYTNTWIFDNPRDFALHCRLKTAGGENYLSNNGGVGNKMGMWSGGPTTDEGTQLYIYPVDAAEDALAIKNLVPTATKMVAQQDKYGYYKSNDGFQSALNAAKAINAKNTADECSSVRSELESAVAGLEQIVPTPGFYRIKNNAGDAHLVAGTSGAVQFAADNASTPNSVFYYDGSSLLSFSNGLYLGDNANQKLQYTGTVGTRGTIEFGCDYNNLNGKVLVYFYNGDTKRGMYSAEAGSTDAGYGITSSSPVGYRFTLEPVTYLPVPMNTDAGYATIYSPVQLGKGYDADRVKVYTAAVNEGKTFVTLTEQDVVPANTGVVLEYVAEIENGCVYLPVQATSATDVASDLKGTLADTYITPAGSETCYVLSKPADSDLSFYKAALNQSENTAFLNNGFKAYLSVEGAANVRNLSVMFEDGSVTGIENIERVEKTNGDNVIYDLSGRRVNKATKGIFIINGKKVIK